LRNRCVRQLLCSRVRIRADAPCHHFADPPPLHFGFLEAPAASLDALANCRYPVEENTSLAQGLQRQPGAGLCSVPASQLNKQQKALLLELIAEYVGNMKEGHARVRMEEVRRHLDRAYFAWIGSANPEKASGLAEAARLHNLHEN
jgi:hypothetical protein